MDEPQCSRYMDNHLTDDEHAALTGWTRRVTEALAHLADAWCIADGGNAPAAELAIAVLIERSRNASQRETWRDFVENCAGGPKERGGRGTELLLRVDRARIHLVKAGLPAKDALL